MKLLFLSIFGLLLLNACQQKGNEAISTNTSSNDGPIVVNKHIVEEPFMNHMAAKPPSMPISTPNDKRAFSEHTYELRKRADQLSPIPMVYNDEPLPMSDQEADEKYRNFVAAHSSDAMLPLFQQRYARILLNQYGIIKGKDAQKITYYLQQLIDGQSFDYLSMTNCLDAINGKIDLTTFNKLRDKVIASAILRQKTTARARIITDKAVVQYQSIAKPTPQERMWLASYKAFQSKMSNDQLTQCVDKLAAMRPVQKQQ